MRNNLLKKYQRSEESVDYNRDRVKELEAMAARLLVPKCD